MESGYYHIPELPEQADTQRDAFGRVLERPETAEQGGRYTAIKAYEVRIEELRRQADATILPRYLLSRLFEPVASRILPRTSPEDMERKLVDAESEIGGQQLKPLPGILSQRFWYYKGHWYYEAVDQAGPVHASYKINDDTIEKIVQGRLVQLEDGEHESLLRNVPEYYHNIAEKLYGRDDYDLAA